MRPYTTLFAASALMAGSALAMPDVQTKVNDLPESCIELSQLGINSTKQPKTPESMCHFIFIKISFAKPVFQYSCEEKYSNDCFPCRIFYAFSCNWSWWQQGLSNARSKIFKIV